MLMGFNSDSDIIEVMVVFYIMLFVFEVDGIDDYIVDIVRDSLVDWIDFDDNMCFYGVEDSEYELKEFFYLVVNGVMVFKLEFCIVNGVLVNWLNEVMFFVCVIFGVEIMVINVNIIEEDNVVLLVGLIGLDII